MAGCEFALYLLWQPSTSNERILLGVSRANKSEQPPKDSTDANSVRTASQYKLVAFPVLPVIKNTAAFTDADL